MAGGGAVSKPAVPAAVETCAAAGGAGLPTRDPHKGWYWHYYDNGTWRYAEREGDWLPDFPHLETIFLRLPWCELEPRRREFRWEILDRVIEPNLAVGRTVAFNISCKETDPRYPRATPGWVEEAGARGRWIQAGGSENWEPDYGDPVFLHHLRAFHEAMAARYDGKRWVEWVDISSYGDWGEGHTQASSKEDWPVEVIAEHFRIYQDCYRQSPLQVNDDLVGSRLDRAGAERLKQMIDELGFQLTDHSVCVDFFVRENGGSSLRQGAWLHEASRRVPVVLESEHYDTAVALGNWRGGSIFALAVEEARATFGGFHGFPRRWLEENVDLASSLGRRLGYHLCFGRADLRFAPFPQRHLVIDFLGINLGVAPLYHPVRWECRVRLPEGELVLPMTEKSGMPRWEPRQWSETTLTSCLPPGLASRLVGLSIRMLDERLDRVIHWQGGDAEGWLDVPISAD